MAREVISEAQLLAILNEKISDSDRCEDCTFPGPIERLDEPDQDGCNWEKLPILTCEGRSPHRCAGLALRTVQEARRQYNLS